MENNYESKGTPAGCVLSLPNATDCFVDAVTHTYTYDEYVKIATASTHPELDAIEIKCCQLEPNPWGSFKNFR